jgi:hypothetical protein
MIGHGVLLRMAIPWMGVLDARHHSQEGSNHSSAGEDTRRLGHTRPMPSRPSEVCTWRSQPCCVWAASVPVLPPLPRLAHRLQYVPYVTTDIAVPLAEKVDHCLIERHFSSV